ncbi:MAG: helix-turn-helix transcriptional regulator [Lachnospiraceae bacterium]
MKFYEKLIILRKKALLSQEELAEKLDVTRQTISKWELGQSKPDIDKLQMMSKLFEVDVNTLTNEDISLEDKGETKEDKNNKKEDGDRKFILYILIIIFIASLAFLTYRVGTDIKAKKDEIKEELRKEKEKAEKKQEEEEKKQQELEDKINKEQEEYHENFSKDSFNSTFEMNQGTKSGMFAKSQVDNIIKNNKKDKEHLIEVIFDGTSYGTDSSNISNVKNNLREFNGYKFQEYEISLDYDDNGYVNKVTIETR